MSWRGKGRSGVPVTLQALLLCVLQTQCVLPDSTGMLMNTGKYPSLIKLVGGVIVTCSHKEYSLVQTFYLQSTGTLATL